MSKIYHSIESRTYTDSLTTTGIVETSLVMTVRTEINPIYFDSTNIEFTKSVDRRKIVDTIYGEYIGHLRDINSMIWSNEDRDIISQKINKTIDSMWGSSND